MKKMRSYDLTVWETREGTVRIRENFNGCHYYCDVNNKYDHECDSREEVESFLESIGAEYVGVDSENDW